MRLANAARETEVRDSPSEGCVKPQVDHLQQWLKKTKKRDQRSWDQCFNVPAVTKTERTFLFLCSSIVVDSQ
jgi:hypothetical protein